VRKPPLLTAVSPKVSTETVQAMRRKVAESERGDLIGIAFVALYSGHEYEVEVVGETRLAPTFTRGMLCLLDDQLAALVAAQQALT
jgi:hypothetical protein